MVMAIERSFVHFHDTVLCRIKGCNVMDGIRSPPASGCLNTKVNPLTAVNALQINTEM